MVQERVGERDIVVGFLKGSRTHAQTGQAYQDGVTVSYFTGHPKALIVFLPFMCFRCRFCHQSFYAEATPSQTLGCQAYSTDKAARKSWGHFILPDAALKVSLDCHSGSALQDGGVVLRSLSWSLSYCATVIAVGGLVLPHLDYSNVHL